MKTTFISVMPNGDGSNGFLRLRIVQDKGIEVTPDVKINVTDLNLGTDGKRFKHFLSHGDGGIVFKIQVLIKKSDTFGKNSYEGKNKVFNVLKGWIASSKILNVATNAIDIPPGTYIITNNSKRVQNFNDYTIWELEFMTFKPLNVVKFKNDNSTVLDAINKAKKAQKSSKSKSTTKSKLSKCKRSTLVYSKKKKVVACVKYLQKVLKQKKFYTGKIDGWFGKSTLTAVKNFQKKWNKTHVKTTTTNKINGTLVSSPNLVTNFNDPNIKLPAGVTLAKPNTNKGATIVTVKGLNKILPTNGKIDSYTFKALCS